MDSTGDADRERRMASVMRRPMTHTANPLRSILNARPGKLVGPFLRHVLYSSFAHKLFCRGR